MPSNNSVRKRVKGIRTGINTLTANYLLQDNEPEIIENWDINEAGYDGVLRKRYGYDRLSSQMASGGTGIGSLSEHTLNGTDYLIGNIINSSSSGLYYQASPYNSTFTAITGSNGSAQAYKLNYASFKNKVYIANRSNGTSTNQVWDGTTTGIYDMGCPPCDTSDMTLTPLNSTGTLTSSTTYMYVVTFLYDGYQESGTLYVKFVTMGGSDDTVNITNLPVSTNARCTARKIYRTKAGASSSIPFSDVYYLTTISNNVQTSTSDYTPDSELTNAIGIENLFTLNRPFKSKYNIIHKERLWQANCIDGLLNASPSAEFTLTPSNGAGALTSGTTYNYRFKKFWFTGLGGTTTFGDGALYCSEYTSKSVVMGASDDTVTISYGGSDPFVKYIAVERAGAGTGSTDYQLTSILSWFWDAPAGDFTDITADASRLGQPLPISVPISTTYTGLIKSSDAGKPDLFSNIETMTDGTLIPASNEWNIGETITGIHSEENRIIIFGQNNIYELDTTTQSRQFWRLNKIVSGTGAKDGLQCQTPEGYFFIQETISNLGTQILRYNNGTVTDVGNIIKTYCFNNSITTFNDIKYYDATREVWVLAENGSITYILKYKIDTGQWRVDVNGTDLNFNVLCPTKSKAMLLGGGDGYVHSRSTALQDKIAGSLTSYTTKVKTKHFNEEDANITPQRFLATLQTSGGSTSTALVRYAVADGTEYTSNLSNDQAGTTNLPDGVHRLRTVSFNDNVTNNGKTDIYFQLETTNAKFEVLKDMAIDLQVKHEASGGK